MPNIIDVINARTELQKKADKYYKAIEQTYYDLNPSYPMNVPAGHKGRSSKPCHHNDYVLARAYYRFLRMDAIDIGAINDLVELFSGAFCKESDYESGKTADNVTVISDAWFESRYDFAKYLQEFKYLLETYKQNLTGDAIDYRAILEKRALRLIEEGFTKKIVQEVGDKILADRKESKQENSVISLEQVVKLNDNFDEVGRRSFSFHFDENGSIVEAPETDESKAHRLEYLFKKLSQKEIDDFRALFVSMHFQKSITEDRGKLFSHRLVFADGESVHRERFKESIETIGRRNSSL